MLADGNMEGNDCRKEIMVASGTLYVFRNSKIPLLQLQGSICIKKFWTKLIENVAGMAMMPRRKTSTGIIFFLYFGTACIPTRTRYATTRPKKTMFPMTLSCVQIIDAKLIRSARYWVVTIMSSIRLANRMYLLMVVNVEMCATKVYRLF